MPRIIQIVGDVAYVPLTKGYVAIIDAEDVRKVHAWDWSARVKGHTVYAQRVFRRDGKSKMVLLHHQLMGIPDGGHIDHINHNGLDNRRSNLRFATESQNQQNRRVSSRSRLGLKGVYFDAKRGKYVAAIQKDKRKQTLGLFETAEEAKVAYDKAAYTLHEQFACT